MSVSSTTSSLQLRGHLTLDNLGPGITAAPTAKGDAAFLRWDLPEPGSYATTFLGQIAALRRFTATHRYEPFWMRPAAGRSHAEVPAETQWLLVETTAGDFILLVPLLSADARFSLQGQSQGLALALETGDPYAPSGGGIALYAARGDDPYRLIAEGARAAASHLGALPLRREKAVPAFVNTFGWCTWDAFYQDVGPEGLREGLGRFRAGGVCPGFVVLDDGWQATERKPTGETRLTSFAPNEKFGADLGPTVRMAKQEFGVQTFLVWHALIGYWGGVDGATFPDYQVIDQARSFGVGVLRHEPHMNVQWWGQMAGLVAASDIARFYDDYHRLLVAQGVDGVKVDTQAMLEGLALRQGGRVALTRAYREALEASVQRHFDGRLINCMSHAMETFYGSRHSTLIRTSTDFWPRKPETHGLHLYTNAQVGAWFGEFMQPDWDMFQSAHEWGAYHAAGRAVSGGPVYVSDHPGRHDFALLRQLVCHDGTILRADHPGRPTPDCLLVDPTREPVLLKIFNRNGASAVVGVFNAQYHAEGPGDSTIDGTLAPSDVPDLGGKAFAAFAHRANRIWRTDRTSRLPLSLPQGGWEIISYSPIRDGFAALGLADKLNSTGAIVACEATGDGWTLRLRDGGTLIAWSEKAPQQILANGEAIVFDFDPVRGALRATVPVEARNDLRICF
jgi:raffinose synthase